jgi:putative hydrolase of the HAD superfamily
VTPQVVVFDAAGTLVEVAGSVGAAYAEDARAAGAELDPLAVERGFARAMRAAPPLAFGRLPASERLAAARAWWRETARAALADAGGLPEGFAFEGFFDRAWERFARAAAWRVPADVRPTLRALRARGVPLAVLSNWDARLGPLLSELGLAGYFCRVLVSSELPAAKPDRAAFDAVARELAGIAATSGSPVMVGDRLDHDVLPALAAGWDAVWLDRRGDGAAPPGARVVRDLRELAPASG